MSLTCFPARPCMCRPSTVTGSWNRALETPTSRKAGYDKAVWEIVKTKVVHHLGNALSSLRVSFLCRLRGQTSIRP